MIFKWWSLHASRESTRTGRISYCLFASRESTRTGRISYCLFTFDSLAYISIRDILTSTRRSDGGASYMRKGHM
ncbi:hypothetical protein PAXRUDRAFT_339204 [Paxillus rubicundulus Ve08.2h10]|uniref:Unplaced genomic scaffold scaffold_1856, whole genome shotgun sequence n=1 Tax=Paxillus rubicundulus Ve08.2h10 TaxID=930991 RepID=A0A0D0CS18_9AGAM|nr:hypothetical protein PAXRUDRAFT_339204 [Paxillus rubicundulus Ve08.2h10]